MKRDATGRAHRAAALFALVAIIGCSDDVGTQPDVEPGAEEILAALPSGIHPVLVVAGQSAEAATVELHLKGVDVDARIASVQGELRYDAERLKLAGAAVPEGIMGAWNEVEQGTLRFAGVALEGLGEDAVVTLSFETREPVDADAFDISIEEVVGAEGFQDLAPQLRLPEADPVLIRGRIPAAR